jgi:hypothetical protein
LKLLVLGFSLPGGLLAGLETDTLQRFWRHTLTRAVAGREISETLWRLPGDDVFIAGLLQDVGMLMLIQGLGEPYRRFLDKATATGADLARLERESMGFDHTMLSARLLASWNLPDTLVEAVASQSGPQPEASSDGESILAGILRPAELVARLLADDQPKILGRLLATIRQTHDFSEVQLQRLVTELEEKVGQLADILSLQLPEGLDYRDVLARAHAQFVPVADSVAEDLLRARLDDAQSEEAALMDELQGLAEAVTAACNRPVEAARSVEPVALVETPDSAATASLSTKAGRAPHGPVALAAGAPPMLMDRLTAAAVACRQARCPLSLLLAQIDKPREPNVRRSLTGAGSWQSLLKTLCETTDHPNAMCFAHGESGYALILPNCERRVAVELGSQWIKRIRSVAACNGRESASISVGAATVALPSKNFPAETLFESANRCLFGSMASGGGVVKSIEI